jgi:hypothetical protein
MTRVLAGSRVAVRWRLGGALVLTVLALSGCSSSGDQDASPSSTAPSRSTSSTSDASSDPSSTTSGPVGSPEEPPATDIGAVTPVLQRLIDRHDQAVAAVLSDPRVARDPDHQMVRDYLALFVPGATFPSGVVEGWVREADAGRFYKPGPAGALHKSTVMSVTPASGNEVSFTLCIRNSVVITSESGTVLEAQGGVSAGEVSAVRVGGVWLLQDLSRIPATDCPAPGEGT